MNEDIEQLREQYYLAILYLQNMEDIKTALPAPTYHNFFNIIEGVITKLMAKLSELEQEKIDNSSDLELIEIIEEEISICRNKIAICQKTYEEAKELQKIEQIAPSVSGKKLVFAKTTSGNIYLERDIKDMSHEFYERVVDALTTIKSGGVKTRNLLHSDKLVGVHEAKEFQIRVIFKNLTEDIIYVLCARVKKDDLVSLDRDEMVLRNQKTMDEFNELKKQLKDEKLKEKIIRENKEIEERIFAYLIGKQRR